MVGKDMDASGLSPWHKIAVLMVALGEEAAGELMRHFGEEEIEPLTQAIADLKNVPSQLQDTVLLELEGVLQEGVPAQGGIEFVRSLLERALGPERAEEMLGRATGGPVTGFKLLRNADPSQVAPLIAQEHPQTIALILYQAESQQAAAILEQLSSAQQAEVVHRIATLGHIAPEILDEVEQTLESILKGVMGGKREVGGSQVVADILNIAGSRLERSVLERIDNADPEVAEEIRNRMFVFDDLAGLGDSDMQMVLRYIDTKDLQVAILR